MALELLCCQCQHLEGVKTARKNGTTGPPSLSKAREVHHDLESFLWVLIYAIMLHNYNSLPSEIDRAAYKEKLDAYFGHGSAHVVVDKRQGMVYLAMGRVGDDSVLRLFPDHHEREFFKSCMSLIDLHDREDVRAVVKKDSETSNSDLSAPTFLWNVPDKSDSRPDGDAEDKSGTYGKGKATEGHREPVITYASVGILINEALQMQ